MAIVPCPLVTKAKTWGSLLPFRLFELEQVAAAWECGLYFIGDSGEPRHFDLLQLVYTLQCLAEHGRPHEDAAFFQAVRQMAEEPIWRERLVAQPDAARFSCQVVSHLLFHLFACWHDWRSSKDSIPGQGFIQVQDGVRNHGPGGQLGHVQLLVSRRFA